MFTNDTAPEGVPDKQTLKRALEAFRKRLELWNLRCPIDDKQPPKSLHAGHSERSRLQHHRHRSTQGIPTDRLGRVGAAREDHERRGWDV
jgi:hypothetical protein